MSNENLYFIKIELPEKQNTYLRQLTKDVCCSVGAGKEINENFHLTVEETLYCPKRSIRVDLNKWLEMQDPFEFTLDRVDFFKNHISGLVYLTTADINEREMISDFHYGIHEMIKSKKRDRQNNIKYTPHVTLLKQIPIEKIDEVQEIFRKNIRPLRVNVSEILVRENNDIYGQQQDIEKFSLGRLSFRIV
jgi:2'-5' RNA ligase